MIIESSGDIFASGCESYVNPVNCHGVNGAGLAKAFKHWAPDAVREFERAVRYAPLLPGELASILSLAAAAKVPFRRAPLIYFFPTKIRWRDDSRIEWIKAGLDELVQRVNGNASTQKDVAIPALGCGLGGLDWAEVGPLILAAAEQMTCERVMVFWPKG